MKIQIKESLVISTLDNEMVILDSDTEEFYGLNTSAVEMWKALGSHPTVEEALQHISTVYPGVEQETLKADLNELIEHFSRLGLITILSE